jgi:cell division control protein 24
MLPSQASTDSLSTDSFPASTPVNAQEAARNNIIREMVETERKYVQDLEIMQVCQLNPLLCGDDV